MDRHNTYFGTFLALLFTFFLVTTVFAAASADTATFTMPVINPDDPEPVFVTCVDKEIELDGFITGVSHSTTDNTGRIHTKVLFKYNDVIGEGLDGESFRGSGISTQNSTSILVGEGHQSVRVTFIERFKLRGSGHGKPYYIDVTMHTSANANGDLTVDFTRSSMTCSRE